MSGRDHKLILTHLQFAVLSHLRDGEQSGRSLRDALDEQGISKSGPAFYQMMARLEDSGFVVGRYADRAIGDTVVKERLYRLDKAGRDAWKATLGFYLRHAGLGEVSPSVKPRKKSFADQR